jgi:uncharacterized protein (UPF0276 family)
MSFGQRVGALPRLGFGVSTEYGAGDAPTALDPLALHATGAAGFLEVGVEVVRGLDRHALAWVGQGLPTTYHFLDINLDEPEDFDQPWLEAVRETCEALRPSWLCGDAGLWHLGPRARGHMLLLPPILEPEAVGPMAEGIVRLREAVGLEVLPENPPGSAFLGDLHLLDFFARVVEAADTGMLLDCAHLTMYQRLMGHHPLTALDGFPLDRVVEIHIAGISERDTDGMAWLEDTHGVEVLSDTWAIVERVVAGAPNLKAVVIECERNPIEAVLPLFDQARNGLHRAGVWA